MHASQLTSDGDPAIAGLAVAFPVGVGLALVLGVITTLVATGSGSVPMLAAGVASIMLAIILDAVAYRRLASASRSDCWEA